MARLQEELAAEEAKLQRVRERRAAAGLETRGKYQQEMMLSVPKRMGVAQMHLRTERLAALILKVSRKIVLSFLHSWESNIGFGTIKTSLCPYL